MAKNYFSSPKKSVRTTSYPAAALNFPRCEASMRPPPPPPRRAHLFIFTICGEGGIRTHEELAPLAVFKTAALGLYATSPASKLYHHPCFFPHLVISAPDFTLRSPIPNLLSLLPALESSRIPSSSLPSSTHHPPVIPAWEYPVLSSTG